jgi:hypothetical protein
MRIRYTIALSLLLATGALARADHLDVYIITGQSNSLGTTNLEGAGFNPGDHPADAVTKFFWSNVRSASSDSVGSVLYGDSNGAITTLQMQQGDGGANSQFWGPEFGMARTLFDSGKANIMVIKASRGGGGNHYWLPTTGHMYSHLLAQVDAALGVAKDEGHTFDVKGFLYLQGESNNTDEAAAAGTRLQTLIDGVQSHINSKFSNAAEDMYSVIGEIASSASSADRITTTNMQKSLATANAAIGFFDTHDQSLKSDNIHFGKDAKLEIGRRYADAFNSRTWIESPNLLAGYSANEGSVNAVPHPISQGLSEMGNSGGVTMQAVNDGGTPAWRIAGNNSSSSPQYRQVLSASDFQQQFDRGWDFRAKAKVVSGGGLAMWSINGAASDPGWSVAARNGNSIGFQLSRVNGDELQVSLLSSESPVNLGPGSADEFHTIELRGNARSSTFDFYIDGELQSAGIDFTHGSGLAGFQNALVFGSGSNGGMGSDVYWNDVSLTAVPEPTSAVLGWPWIGVAIAINGRHRRWSVRN